MPQVTKEEVEFLKESVSLLKVVLPYLQNYQNFEVTISFDEKNTLPVIKVKKG